MTSILIVDDEKDLLEILTKGFQSAGFKVFSASETEEAVAALNEHQPEVILTDIKMPGGGGLEIARVLKTQSTYQPKLFFMTGFDDLSEVEAKKLNAISLFNKPTPILDMISNIKSKLA